MFESKNVAFYIRLSMEDTETRNTKKESNSITNQRNLLTSYYNESEELKNANVFEFCDDGYTGTNFDRPEFKSMIQMVENKKIDCIIVKDFSRFGRDYLELGAYLEQIFPALGVRFISVNDHFDSFSYIGTTGGMNMAFQNLIYSLYSKDLSSKTKSARLTRSLKGEFIGSYPFYGYNKSPDNKRALIIDDEVVPVIKKIFSMAIEGKTTYEIAKRLNELNILCPYEYKKSKGIDLNRPLVGKKAIWIAGTVGKIIKDERYLGTMVTNRFRSSGIGKKACYINDKTDWIKVEHTHDPIITVEEFQLANKALSEKIRTVNYNTSWKNSKNIFVCGHCGHRLVQTQGKVKSLYCLSQKMIDSTECSNLLVDKTMIEGNVLEVVQNFAKVFINASEIIKKKVKEERKELEAKINSLEQRIGIIKGRKIELYTEFKEGKFTKEEFIAQQEQDIKTVKLLQTQLTEHEEHLWSIDKLEEKVESSQFEFLKEEFGKFNLAVLSRIIEKVLIYDSAHIEVKFKNEDQIKEIIEVSKNVAS